MMNTGQESISATTRWQPPLLSDEKVAQLNGLVGKPIEEPREQWEIDEAAYSIGAIKRVARAMGDRNPLWWDEDYAPTSRYGRMVVPPGIVVEWEQLDPEVTALPGCHAVLNWAELTLSRPILQDDSLLATTCVREVDDRKDPSKGRMVSYTAETAVRNTRLEAVGSYVAKWTCYERQSAAEAALYAGREPAFYTVDDLIGIHQEYHAQEPKLLAAFERRRSWRDVEVGEELPYVLKGPTVIVRRVHRWCHYGMSYERLKRWYHGHGESWAQYERNPELFIINEFGAPEPLEAVDLEHERCQNLYGSPGAIEHNSERIHWTIQLLARWSGEDGFLKELKLDFPQINMLGDLTRCYGQVTRKWVEGDEHLIEVTVRNVNQTGAIVTTGGAVVRLPA